MIAAVQSAVPSSYVGRAIQLAIQNRPVHATLGSGILSLNRFCTNLASPGSAADGIGQNGFKDTIKDTETRNKKLSLQATQTRVTGGAPIADARAEPWALRRTVGCKATHS